MTMARFILFDGNVVGLATQGRILLAGTIDDCDAEGRGSPRATDFRLQLLFSRAIGSAAALCCSLAIEVPQVNPARVLELLAVVHGLKVLRPYFLDKPFELYTDNASL